MDQQPVIHALVATTLALVAAGGSNYAARTSKLLRDIARDPATDLGTAAILRDVLMAMGGEE